MSQAVVRVKSRDELFREVVRVTADFGGFKLVLVGGRIPDSEQITLIARAGTHEGSLAELQIYAEDCPGDPSPIATCLREGRPSVVNDLHLASESLPWRAPALGHGLRAAAVMPIAFQGAIWGVFAVYDAEPHAFQDQELALLEEAARNISYSMENLEQEARRQAAEAALRASEERYRLLAENAEDFVVVAEPGGRLLYVSPSFYRVTGWSPEEIQALDRPTWFHPDDCELVAKAVAANRAGASVQIEYRIQCRDGSWLWVDTRAKPTLRPDGEVQHLQLWSRNITERKRIELEHLRLVAAIQQATDAILITDTAGTILYVNPAFERVTGYHREEAVGQNPRILRSGKHDADFYTRMWATLSRGDVWSGRIINRCKDGALIEEDANISPVRDAAGRIANFVAVKRDVTREVQLEAQFRQAQKTEAIGQLAGGIAHDFNNILAEILLQAELELNDAQLGPSTRESLREIKLSAERAASLTRQLLLFSRRQVMQPRIVDLNEIVVSVTKMLRRILGEDIRLQLELHPTPLWTLADTGMLDQVLLNLAVNARDTMPGGGQLTIATGEVTFSTQPPAAPPDIGAGRYVSLRVCDTGCGIPAEVLPRIFEPFFTTKEVGRGTGLGLATVLGIVKQHRGWIDVANNPGPGATFQIQFPARPAPAIAIEAPRPLPQPNGGAETILLVEDEPSLRRVTRGTLERQGYHVLEAAHGPEALSVYGGASRPIDLLLTDMVLPEGLDGRGLATQLLRQQPGLRVIYMSGYSAELAGRNLTLQPGQQFLQKPCSREVLLAAIRLSLDDLSSHVHAHEAQAP